jgi:hypothetical protein
MAETLLQAFSAPPMPRTRQRQGENEYLKSSGLQTPTTSVDVLRSQRLRLHTSADQEDDADGLA